MIGLAQVGFAIALVTLVGHCFARHFTLGLCVSEVAAWSLAIGFLIQAAVLVAMVAIHARPTRLSLIAIDTILGVLASRMPNLRGQSRVRRNPLHFQFLPLLLLAALGGVLYSIQALAQPMAGPDFWAIWGLKGKVIFQLDAIPAHLFEDPALYFAHPEYPLLLPLTFAAVAKTAGGWNDSALALLYPVWQLATVLAVVGFLRRRADALAAAASGCLVAWFAPLYCSASIGVAEVPLAFGIVLLSTAALDLVDTLSMAALLRFGVAGLMCSNLKREGLLFATLLVAMLMLMRRPTRERLRLAYAYLPILCTDLTLRVAGLPLWGRDFRFQALMPGHWTELGARLEQAVATVASMPTRASLLFAAAVAVALLLGRRSFADWLLVPLTAQWVAYWIAISLSSFGVGWLARTAFARISDALVPAVILVAGVRVSLRSQQVASGLRASNDEEVSNDLLPCQGP
jgi:hypothetical protein